MSGKMFESVLVERECYALPIVVQYERQPLYCVQCKMLGHSTQNCKKLHQEDPTNATKKVQNDSHNIRQKPRLQTQVKQHSHLLQIDKDGVVHKVSSEVQHIDEILENTIVNLILA